MTAHAPIRPTFTNPTVPDFTIGSTLRVDGSKMTVVAIGSEVTVLRGTRGAEHILVESRATKRVSLLRNDGRETLDPTIEVLS